MALTLEYVYGLRGQCHPRLGYQGDGLMVVTGVFVSGNSFFRMLTLRSTDFWISRPSQMPEYCSIMWQAPGMRYCTGLTRFLPQGNCIAVEGGRERTEDILSETDSCRKGTIHQECSLMKMDSLYWDIRVETGPWGRKELKGSRMVEVNVAGS